MEKHPKNIFKNTLRVCMSGQTSHKIIIAICLIVSAVTVYYILSLNRQNQPQASKFPPPVAVAKPANETVVTSPDGKWTLTMKSEKSKETVYYRFLITGPNVSNKEVFARSLPADSSITIPANTFSPDDKYFFLKESSVTGVSYLVFTTSGEPISTDAQNLDFAPMFSAKHENYKITDATGWGGVNLIVFNTDKVDGGTGPSFWFEVPSKAFIQLSNRFN